MSDIIDLSNPYTLIDALNVQIAALTRRIELDATNWKVLWDGAQEDIERLTTELVSFEGHHQATHDALYEYQEKNKQLDTENERLKKERECLGQSMRQVCVNVGMIREDATPTGPELIMFTENLERDYTALQKELKAAWNRVTLCEREEIPALQKEVEDLKCCGNCKAFKGGFISGCYYKNGRSANEICPDYQSDSLTRKEREG